MKYPLNALAAIVFLLLLPLTALAQAETQNPTFPFWKVNGNSGTTAGTNFIGTTDAVDWVVKTNNTERMRVLSTGNVGIGTATPVSPLHVAYTTGNGPAVTIESGNSQYPAALSILPSTHATSRRSAIRLDDWYFVQDITGTGPKDFTLFQASANQHRISVTTGGNVGIGTTTASQKLDVVGAGLFRNGANGVATTGDQLLLSYNATTNYRHAIKTRHHSGQDQGNAIDFFVWDFGTDAAGTTGSKRVLTIDGDGTNGRVGIGVSIPTTELDVNGKTRTTTFQMTTGGTNNYILKSDATGNGTWADITTLLSASTDWSLTGNSGTTAGTNFIGTTDAVAWVVKTNNTERMRVLSTGNLGIGLTNPQATLHVHNNIALDNANSNAGDLTTGALTFGFGLSGEGIASKRTAGGNQFGLDFYTNNINRMSISLGGNVGLGTSAPAQRLHINGNDGVVRAGSIATGGNNIAAPAATTDKLLYADANGDIKAIANGSNGDVLTVNGSGVPAWTSAAASTDWNLTGNSGTTPGTNFLGTTDAQALMFKVNNVKAGYIDNSSSTANTGIGYQTLLGNANGASNTAVGYTALAGNTNAGQNTAIGKEALLTQSYANSGTAWNTDNTAVGYRALYSNQPTSNSNGHVNTAIGSNAMRNNTTGYANVAVGFQAMQSNTSGLNNTAMGWNALNTTTTSTGNTAIGYASLSGTTTGSANTVVGIDAARNNTTGSSNAAYGMNALRYNVRGSNATAIGANALQNSNSTATAFTNTNVAVGYEAIRGSGVPADNTGNNNTGVGYQVLQNNAAGGSNVALGYQSLLQNISGGANVATGYQSLTNNTIGYSNTANGHMAGRTNTTGARNTLVGDSADVINTGLVNATAIGWNARVDADNSMVLGSINGVNGATTTVKVGIGTTTPAQRLELGGADGIARLGSVATGGNNIAAPAATSDKLLYADASGDVKAIANGSNGDILTINGSGVPAWASAGSSTDWSLTGNTGTTDGVDFIGTTDNVPFTIRTNNQQSGRVDPLLSSAFWGYWAGRSITTGTQNVAVGTNALTANTTGVQNTAIGTSALEANINAGNNVAVGYGALTTQSYTNGGTAWTSNNTAVGYQALYANQPTNTSTGRENTAVGSKALMANTTGYANVAVGYQALTANTSGLNNTSVGWGSMGSTTSGHSNAAIGFWAMVSNTTGFANTAVGVNALRENTIGTFNTAYGNSALYSGKAGTGAVAIGNNALYYANNTTTAYTHTNVAVGNEAMKGSATPADNTGNHNVAVGYQSLPAYTSGSNNLAAGYKALFSNTSGFSNVAIGHSALYSNADRYNLVAVGDSALYSNGTGASGLQAYYNTAIGSKAMRANTTGGWSTAVGYRSLVANTTGDNNTAIGSFALERNTTGAALVAVGSYALDNNTTGSHNVGVGISALNFTSTGTQNVGMGSNALYSNSTGSNNTAIGCQALFSSTASFNTAVGQSAGNATSSGAENTAMGYTALSVNTTGFNNVAVGSRAGNIATTNDNCTFVGYDADNTSSTAWSNSMALGNGARIDASNKVVVGNTAVTYIGGQVGWTTISDGRYKNNVRENVPGLAFIMKLRPVTYNYDIEKMNLHNNYTPQANELAGVRAAAEIVRTGFIAQEVEQSAKETNFNFDGVCKPEGENDNYGLRYAEFTVPLVKAVQEQQQVIETIRAENAELKARLAAIEKMLLVSGQVK